MDRTASEQRDRKTQYQEAKAIFVSQENVRMAINKALMVAVPKTFRRAGEAIGPPVYTMIGNLGEILLDLQRIYGKSTPSEKTAVEAAWRETWNSTEPIENMFLNLDLD